MQLCRCHLHKHTEAN